MAGTRSQSTGGGKGGEWEMGDEEGRYRVKRGRYGERGLGIMRSQRVNEKI